MNKIISVILMLCIIFAFVGCKKDNTSVYQSPEMEGYEKENTNKRAEDNQNEGNTSIDNKPTDIENKPADTENKPTDIGNKPTDTENKPADINAEKSKMSLVEIYTYAYGKKDKSENVFGEKKFIPWINIKDDLTFIFRVNMFVGMADLTGTVKIDGSNMVFLFDEKSKEFFEEDANGFTLEQTSDNEWVYRGIEIGAVRDGNIYTLGELPNPDEPIFEENIDNAGVDIVVNTETAVHIDDISLKKETKNLGSFLQFSNGVYYKIPVINTLERTIFVTGTSEIIQVFNNAKQKMWLETIIWTVNYNGDNAVNFARNFKEFLDGEHDNEVYKSSEIHDEGDFYWLTFEATGRDKYEKYLETIIYKQVNNKVFEIRLYTDQYSKEKPDQKWFLELHNELLEYCQKEQIWCGSDIDFNINLD